MEPPPGGPPDMAPPQLVSTRPDSMARIPDFKGDVEFQFDEVISEGSAPSTGAGTGDLEKLVLLSPSVKVPDVSWRRSRIAVRPADGWKANRVYRVELLPGVADLRRNRSLRGTVLTFTTGAPLPTTTLEGTVVDWRTNQPAPAALVDALLMPDSLPYRALADSSGHFEFGPLPAGEYIVKGILDENHDFRTDGREAYDSVHLARGRTAAGELWAFVHDTTPIRIRTVTVADSVSATIELSQSLDPKQRLAPAQATLRSLPDSAALPIVSLLPKPLDDSLNRRTPAPDTAAADTTRSDTTRADSAGRARPGIVELQEPGAGQKLKPLTSRPPLTDRLVLRVPKPWKPGGHYEVEIRGLRNVSGVAADTAKGALTVPEPAAADTSAARRGRDSLQRRPDSSSTGPTPSNDDRSSGHRDGSAALPSVGGPPAARARRRSAAGHRAAGRRRGSDPGGARGGARPPGRTARGLGRGDPRAPGGARTSEPAARPQRHRGGAAHQSRPRAAGGGGVRCGERHRDGLQQPRARARHRHARPPHGPLPRAPVPG